MYIVDICKKKKRKEKISMFIYITNVFIEKSQVDTRYMYNAKGNFYSFCKCDFQI